MIDGRWASALAILAWLVLVVVGVSRRRMPRAIVWRYAAIWATVFTFLFIAALWLEMRR